MSAGAKLLSLPKPDAGIRPIAVRNTLPRLTGKCVSKNETPRFLSHFEPIQLWTGRRSGFEAAVYAARALLADARNNTALLQMDFRNAFNMIRRDTAAEVISEKAPGAYKFYQTCYKSSTLL